MCMRPRAAGAYVSSYNAGKYISCIIEIGNYVACASGSHEGVGDVELLHCEEASQYECRTEC